jgi:NAD(P)-dependent dehydrogenase (short-subunit alcohol dehydrogenase family)
MESLDTGTEPAAKPPLEGRVAVVTGASRGLGAEIATGLAVAGAAVALVARDAGALGAVGAAIRDRGAKASVFPADVSSGEQVERLRRDVARVFGPPDVLVNAAGVFGPLRLIAEGDPHEWVEALTVNLIGPYLTCRTFLPPMLERRFGCIVNVSSAGALYPPGKLDSAYVTSKVALNQLTRHLAAELEGTGVTANVIHPGDVKTDMWRTIRDAAEQLGPDGEEYREWAAAVDESGGDRPEKAAALVVRLASDEQGIVNGRFLWIDEPMQPMMPSWD